MGEKTKDKKKSEKKAQKTSWFQGMNLSLRKLFGQTRKHLRNKRQQSFQCPFF